MNKLLVFILIVFILAGLVAGFSFMDKTDKEIGANIVQLENLSLVIQKAQIDFQNMVKELSAQLAASPAPASGQVKSEPIVIVKTDEETKQKNLELQAQLVQVQEGKEVLDEQIRQLTKTKSELESQLSLAKTGKEELAQVKDEYQNQINKAEADLIDRDRKISRLETEISRFKTTPNQDIENLKDENSRQAKELDKVKGLYGQLKDQLKTLGAMLSRRENIIKEKDKQIDSLNNQITAMRVEQESLKGAFNKMRQTQSALKEKVAKLGDVGKDFQDSLGQVDSLLSSNQAEVMKVKDEPVESAVNDTVLSPVQDDFKDEPADKAKADELKKKVEVILFPNQ